MFVNEMSNEMVWLLYYFEFFGFSDTKRKFTDPSEKILRILKTRINTTVNLIK